jgi:primase-polymerase (primpol)-like protein
MSSSEIDERLIPDRLAECEQWICWQEVERDGKPTKVPIKPYHTSGTSNASATDPATWRDLQSALEFHQSDRVDTDGIGFVFASETSIVGVDLDDCRDPATGDLTDWARDIVDRLDSYTEVSPSGRGVHVLLEGELPPGRNRRGNVEMYDEARFFTVTTNHVDGTPETIARRQDALLGVHYEYVQTSPDSDTEAVDLDQAIDAAAETGNEAQGGESTGDGPDGEPGDGKPQALGSKSSLYARYGLDFPDIEDPALEVALHSCSVDVLPDNPPTSLDEIAGPGVDLDDDALLEQAMASKSGDTIAALYDGDKELWASPESRYPSQSEADMGLCFYLGFWTGGDPERMDRLFRNSGLYRGKWDRVHFANGATYGDVCIARTLLTIDDYYTPPTNQERSTPDDREENLDEAPASEASIHDTGSSPVGTGAVDDARRLAAKVQRQQRELEEKRERIAELETLLRQYRTVLGIDPASEKTLLREQGNTDTANGSRSHPIHQSSTERNGDSESEDSGELHSNGRGDHDKENTAADDGLPSRKEVSGVSEAEKPSSSRLLDRLRRRLS